MRKFNEIEAWVFDLDNTLYPLHHNLFEQVDKRMTAFIQDALDVDRDQAYFLQKSYLREFGTSLAGLMKRHGMKPDNFLEFVHDIDVSVLTPDPALHDAIAALPGRKFIFTNGTTRHAENVANRLGVMGLFEDVFDIVAANYIPKPNADIYPAMLERFNISADKSAFFEDMARNLAPAHELGMTTVLVQDTQADAQARAAAHIGDQQTDSSFIHHATDDLTGFLTSIGKLHNNG